MQNPKGYEYLECSENPARCDPREKLGRFMTTTEKKIQGRKSACEGGTPRGGKRASASPAAAAASDASPAVAAEAGRAAEDHGGGGAGL